MCPMKKIIITAIFVCLMLCGCAKNEPIRESTLIETNPSDYDFVEENAYGDLLVPTYITEINGAYFIVDCYHNQVLYSFDLGLPIGDWFIMTSDIKMGHTIASDGQVYLLDDTENNRILVMEKKLNGIGNPVFMPTQEFDQIGNRPHYILYDEPTKTFYAWSSMSGEMFCFSHDEGDTRMHLDKVMSIPNLDGYYARSFSIIDNEFYIVSGDANIYRCSMDDFSVIAKYPVSPELVGMSQLVKIQDYYYLTISTDNYGNQDAATLIRTTQLENLVTGDYEDIYDNFIGGGTPYCITYFEGHYYLCEHRLPGHSIWQFEINDNCVTNVTTLY